ncbi:hypothetical protein B0T18DRAFT_80258 [Schizothecium vesticola]|uniref:Uncharacterized protein n=1 Tax=Schizothecium vesticola TaxID=314040 RepID=A0AA40F610_9PEZI|nr:hypothetical protein B0T18DRAFT_80258 [Schizothecium vesticola]
MAVATAARRLIQSRRIKHCRHAPPAILFRQCFLSHRISSLGHDVHDDTYLLMRVWHSGVSGPVCFLLRSATPSSSRLLWNCDFLCRYPEPRLWGSSGNSLIGTFCGARRASLRRAPGTAARGRGCLFAAVGCRRKMSGEGPGGCLNFGILILGTQDVFGAATENGRLGWRDLESDLEFGWRRYGNRLSRAESRARSDGLGPGEGGWWKRKPGVVLS